MKIHFIAIGGAVMHNLAIALHKKGYRVTGSDDEIFEPSRSRLEKYGLLPDKKGWDEARILPDLDAVILGMHARKDNPELQKAIVLGIKIYSFPEFLYEQTKDKKRVVIAGSHGKTTITSMVMHVLREKGIGFDYMVGSAIDGFETMVGLDPDSEIAVFEGDEYLSSPLDLRPKFAHYLPHLTLISGIAWDHINVYPEYSGYRKQFRDLAENTLSRGELVYFGEDGEIRDILQELGRGEILHGSRPYHEPEFRMQDDKMVVIHRNKEYPVNLIGRYNLQNLAGAMEVCLSLGVEAEEFLKAMGTFRGAARRQECLWSGDKMKVYLDFAHAPSKVGSTVKGFREMYPEQKLIVFLELHTFSSLNREFIPRYKDTLEGADEAWVFFDPGVVKQKKLQELEPEFVQHAFGREGLEIVTDPEKFGKAILKKLDQNRGIILIMSSGNLDGLNIRSAISQRFGKE